MMGCTTLTTKIIMPDGKIIEIQNKPDGFVNVKIDGMDITVDNKKPLGVIQSLIGLGIMKTNIEISNKDKGD
jgi:hypothetical protein